MRNFHENVSTTSNSNSSIRETLRQTRHAYHQLVDAVRQQKLLAEASKAESSEPTSEVTDSSPESAANIDAVKESNMEAEDDAEMILRAFEEGSAPILPRIEIVNQCLQDWATSSIPKVEKIRKTLETMSSKCMEYIYYVDEIFSGLATG